MTILAGKPSPLLDGPFGQGEVNIYSFAVHINDIHLHRNFKLAKLQYKHLEFGCLSDDSFKIPHWKIKLKQ